MKGGHSLGQGVDGAEYIGLGAPLPFGGRDSWGGDSGSRMWLLKVWAGGSWFAGGDA